MRNATSESWRISLSVSCDTPFPPYTEVLVDRPCGKAVDEPRRSVRSLRGCARFQVLVRRAVVALRQRRPLARLALPGRRAAACDAAVERAGLDLILDELHGCADPLGDRPRDLGLAGDREVAPDVLEQGAIRLGEIERVAGKPLHRLLAGGQDRPAGLQLRDAVAVRVDHVFDRPINGTRVLIHAVLQLKGPLFDHQCVQLLELPAISLLEAGKGPGESLTPEAILHVREGVTNSAALLPLLRTMAARSSTSGARGRAGLHLTRP